MHLSGYARSDGRAAKIPGNSAIRRRRGLTAFRSSKCLQSMFPTILLAAWALDDTRIAVAAGRTSGGESERRALREFAQPAVRGLVEIK